MNGRFLAITAQAVLVGSGLLLLGGLLVAEAFRSRDLPAHVRWALVAPALVAWSLVLMLLHILTRGWVFSHPWAVRGATGALALVLGWRALRHRPDRWHPGPEAKAAAAVAVGAVVLWGLPILHHVPLGGIPADTGWHLGWAGQLLNGSPTPTSILSGAVPNYYPWLFHALLAFVAAFSPGGHAADALPPVQLLQVAGAILGLFALGREVGGRWLHGVATAFLGGIGSSTFTSLIPAVQRVVHTPIRGGPRGTYNATVNNLAPPLPRDVGYMLFVAFLVLLALGVRRRSVAAFTWAGVVLGMIGLTSVEFLFVGLVAGLGVIVVVGGLPRARAALAVSVPAVGLTALWLAPLMASALRLGGLVNTTVNDERILGAGAILLSWGLVTPLAVAGLVLAIRRARRDPVARLPLVALVAAALVLGATSVIPAVLGNGFEILGRASRFWPVLELTLAILGGVALGQLLGSLSTLRAGMVAVVVLGLMLPVSVEESVRYSTKSVFSGEVAKAMLGRPEPGRRGRPGQPAVRGRHPPVPDADLRLHRIPAGPLPDPARPRGQRGPHPVPGHLPGHPVRRRARGGDRGAHHRLRPRPVARPRPPLRCLGDRGGQVRRRRLRVSSLPRPAGRSGRPVRRLPGGGVLGAFAVTDAPSAGRSRRIRWVATAGAAGFLLVGASLYVATRGSPDVAVPICQRTTATRPPASATVGERPAASLDVALAPDGTVAATTVGGRRIASLGAGGFSARLVGGMPNILPDPGFELDRSGDGVPDGWSFGPGATQVALDDGTAHSGRRSVRLSNPTVETSGTVALEVPVQPETAYTFSAWFRSQAIQPTIPPAVREPTAPHPPLRVEIELLAGTRVVGSAAAYGYTDSAAWNRQTAGFRTGPAVDRVRVVGSIEQGSGTGWIDDVSLAELYQPRAIPARGTTSSTGHTTRLQAGLAGQPLALRATFTDEKGDVRVEGAVEGLDRADHALTLTFTLPVRAVGWEWGTTRGARGPSHRAGSPRSTGPTRSPDTPSA